jgi:hypothetical protein
MKILRSALVALLSVVAVLSVSSTEAQAATAYRSIFNRCDSTYYLAVYDNSRGNGSVAPCKGTNSYGWLDVDQFYVGQGLAAVSDWGYVYGPGWHAMENRSFNLNLRYIKRYVNA